MSRTLTRVLLGALAAALGAAGTHLGSTAAGVELGTWAPIAGGALGAASVELAGYLARSKDDPPGSATQPPAR